MKVIFKRIFSVIVVFAATGWLFWQGASAQKAEGSERSFFAMDTYFHLKAYGTNAEKALQECEEKVIRMENDLSVTMESSDIFRLNHSPEKQDGVELSENTFELVSGALDLCARTQGALDITLYPALKLWGFTQGDYQIPDKETLQTVMMDVGYCQVQLDASRKQIRMPFGTELDLGAVAKGYTGDVLIQSLKEAGITSAVLDLGGNIQVLGTRPDGSAWKIGIKNPLHPGEVLGVVEVVEQAVVTSGNYERYFVGDDGQIYGHILNPQTGYPVDGELLSVTVIGKEGMLCDGLSTALFVQGKEAAVSYWRACHDFEMILVEKSGRVLYTEGLAGRFAAEDGWDTEVIYAD